MKNTNFITIQGWMINELKLKGNELILYALIYGFSQEEQKCRASISYIEKALGVSRKTAIGLIKKLVDKELIKKEEDSQWSLYTTCQFNLVEKVYPSSGKSTPVGSGESTPNIYINNNINNNKSDKSSKEAEDILDLYIKRIKLRWTYNSKFHKKKLSIERIQKALKKKTKTEIETIIGTYIRESSESIRGGYAKMAQYFFGPIERGSKIMYYEEFETDVSPRAPKKEFNVGF